MNKNNFPSSVHVTIHRNSDSILPSSDFGLPTIPKTFLMANISTHDRKGKIN
jgi:hypothetical protein